MYSCLLYAPYWGPGLQPRHVFQGTHVTGNRTSNVLVHRLALNTLSHTSQGYLLFLYRKVIGVPKLSNSFQLILLHNLGSSFLVLISNFFFLGNTVTTISRTMLNNYGKTGIFVFFLIFMRMLQCFSLEHEGLPVKNLYIFNHTKEISTYSYSSKLYPAVCGFKYNVIKILASFSFYNYLCYALPCI